MNKNDIVEFLAELEGAKPQVQIVGGWVSCRCPLAPFTHTKRHDRHPSFGVSITDDRPSIFNCFTCGRKGTLMYLAKLMGEYTGEDFTHLSDEAEITEIIGSQAQEWEKLRGNVEKLPDPVGPEYWDVYDEAEGHPYLRKRGIEDSTAELLRLKIDPDDHGVERVLFPVCQLDGGLQGFTGRATNDISEPKVRDYFGLNKRMLLLGADLANQQDKTARLVLVEGPFDCARLWQYGVPAVAALHSRITSAQAKILKKLKRPVVVMLDNDVAGRNGTIEVKRLVHGHIPLLKVRYPEGVKDPDGLTEIQLRRMLDSTRLL